MSGIYIPGMEMPTGTDVLTIAIDSHGKLYSIYVSDGELGINPLHKSVIPVPDHGRLIDESMIPWCVDWYVGRKRYYTTPKTVEHLPTVIPADKEGEK